MCPSVRLLRIHLLQQWFTLSDPLMEEMLIDTPCFRRFAGIDLIDGRIPDETTILNFRHLLEEHQIAEQVLEHVNQTLSEQGLLQGLLEVIPEALPLRSRATPAASAGP